MSDVSEPDTTDLAVGAPPRLADDVPEADALEQALDVPAGDDEYEG